MKPYYVARAAVPPRSSLSAVYVSTNKPRVDDRPWPEEIPVAVGLPYPRGASDFGWAWYVPLRYLRGPRACPLQASIDGLGAAMARIYLFACLRRTGLSEETVHAVCDVDPRPGPPWPGVFEPFLPPECWRSAELVQTPLAGRAQAVRAAEALVRWTP